MTKILHHTTQVLMTQAFPDNGNSFTITTYDKNGEQAELTFFVDDRNIYDKILQTFPKSENFQIFKRKEVA